MFVSKIQFQNFKSFKKGDIALQPGFNTIVGPNGSGKCVKGDSKVILPDGRVCEIKSLVEDALLSDSNAIDDGFVSLKPGISVFSLNPKTLKVEEKPVTAFVKRKSPQELFELSTRTGRRITSTGYHPLLVLKDGILQNLPADQLEKGMVVVIPRSLNFREQQFNPLVALAKLDSSLYCTSSELRSLLKNKKKALCVYWKQIAAESQVSLTALESFLEGQAIKLNDAFKLCVWLGLGEFEAGNYLKFVKGRSFNKPIRIPEVFSEDLAKFLGYVISEGRVANNEVFFYNSSPEVLADFEGLCERLFSKKPVMCFNGNQKFLLLVGKPVVALLDYVFKVREYGHSSTKQVPPQLFHSSLDVCGAFLSAYLDGDGSVSAETKGLEATSASKNLAWGLQLLLSKFGVVSTLHECVKYASNTTLKTRRSYWRIAVQGLDNLSRMKGFLKFSILQKRIAFEALFEADYSRSNALFDSIPGAEKLAKTVLKQTGYGSKRLRRVKPSLLRAYAEKRCSPSVKGLRALVSFAREKGVVTQELEWLETLSESGVYWDALVEIRKVSGEEWVYDLCVDGNHNFLAEGIFVHNSNVCDGLLFSFGESRLKTMRVKKIRDLIFEGASVAEATVVLSDGARERVIKRAVRKDGKIKYSLDGKRVKKYVLEEFLAQNSIALHNFIKQGEVQRIVEMNSKDRRLMIDFIAGVSEYEEKKREAFGELDKVQSKVSEERAVISEKEGYLQELAEEKKSAEKFVGLDSELKKTKATVLRLELDVLEKEFETLINSGLDLDNKIRALGDEIKSLEDRIAETNKRKDDVNKQIIEKSEGKEGEIQRQVDLLQNEIDNSKKLIEQNKEELKARDKTLAESSVEKRKAEDSLSYAKKEAMELEEELSSTQKILGEKQAEYDAIVSKSEAFSQQFHHARAQMSSLEQELLQVKDRLNQLQGEVSTSETILRLKQDELERLQSGRGEDHSDEKGVLSKHVENLTAELRKLDAQVKDLAVDEQKFTNALENLDGEILKCKERISVADARLRAAGSSKAVEIVEKLRGEMKGVYGTVQQLIDYEQAYALPVSIALGNRMHYAVVDSVKTAGKAIDVLKKNNWGRVSFIPLDKIKPAPINADEAKLKGEKGAVDFLINLLKFESDFEKAIKYVCSNTLVMQDFASAEKLVGKTRMVTLDGELLEQSGLVTGGKSREEINPFAEAKELKKWEDRLDGIKGEKEGYAQRLSQARGDLGDMRKRKAELEVEKTKAELELRNILEQEKAWEEKNKNVVRAAAQLKQDVSDLKRGIDDKSQERNGLVRRISDLNSKYLQAKEMVDSEKEAQFGTLVREKEKRLSDLKIQVADYSSQISGKKAAVSSLEKQFEVHEKRERELEGEARRLREENDAADERIQRSNLELRVKIEEQKRISSAIRNLLEAREEHEKQVSAFGEMKGKVQADLELRIKPKREELGYKRAGTEARLTELKAQYSAFEGVELVDGEKGVLLVRTKELEQEIVALGAINMRAIDAFEEKTREFAQHKERLQQLENERLAVLALITEIEGRKKETFMAAFERVNENFQKLFKHIFTGDGSLLLENSENPFDGGLTMQVKLQDKEVKYLELMSGGEKSLLALLFIFAMQGINASSVYVLDEADAALDEENSTKLALLLKALSDRTQFIVVTHNEAVYRNADCLVGVAMAGREGSKLVEVKLSQAAKV
ncbi:AAA family ATPase [Candidatus Micrarchaeota archaeon]|nr:AAA family ATPase [Candidatus Micrarchaeota archaeon]